MLKELLAKLAEKKAAGLKALEELNKLSAKADRTDEETTRVAALEASLTALEAEVEQLAGQVEREQKKAKRGALFATSSLDQSSNRSFGAAGRTLNEPNPETTFGFRSMTEFALAVRSASTGMGQDARLGAALEASATTYNQNQGSGGEGYIVPPEFSRSVWELALENTDLFGMAQPEPTQSNSVMKPKDESTPWGAVGVQAYWAAEAAALTASKMALTGEIMGLHKIHAFVAATDEVLSDAPMLQDRLTRQAGNALRWKISDAVPWGSGVGQLTGFMKAPSLITVAKEAGQAAATINVANLAKMLAALLRVGGSPMWMANPDIIPQLVQLTIGNVPAYLPLSRPIEGSPFEGTIWGYPVMFTEHADTLGNTGDLSLINLGGYYAVNKQGGVDFAQSIHLYFDQGLTAFRWTSRVAGQPYLAKPIDAARGATKKSHFVTLQAR